MSQVGILWTGSLEDYQDWMEGYSRGYQAANPLNVPPMPVYCEGSHEEAADCLADFAGAEDVSLLIAAGSAENDAMFAALSAFFDLPTLLPWMERPVGDIQSNRMTFRFGRNLEEWAGYFTEVLDAEKIMDEVHETVFGDGIIADDLLHLSIRFEDTNDGHRMASRIAADVMNSGYRITEYTAFPPNRLNDNDMEESVMTEADAALVLFPSEGRMTLTAGRDLSVSPRLFTPNCPADIGDAVSRSGYVNGWIAGTLFPVAEGERITRSEMRESLAAFNADVPCLGEVRFSRDGEWTGASFRWEDGEGVVRTVEDIQSAIAVSASERFAADGAE